MTDPEPAIPEHLHQERTVPARMPENHTPPFPSYMARYPESTKNLVMAVFGAQSSARASDNHVSDPLSTLASFVSSELADSSDRPHFHETAAFEDAKGYYNEMIVAYWSSTAAYNGWKLKTGFEDWWTKLDPEQETNGWFLEGFLPSMDRFETISSHNSGPEGAIHLRENFSGPVREHLYWGSMRDRLPASQTDTLSGAKADWVPAQPLAERPTRVRVPGLPNLAVIRSGQNWADAGPQERDLYHHDLEPTLRKGMDYLRDNGHEVGCLSCRLVDITNPVTGKADRDRTFGLAYFDELASLEHWSKEHITHLNIFSGFYKYVESLQGVFGLRLYHEVLVLKPEQQFLEYVGCHSATGLLSAVYGHPGLQAQTI
ncbi:heme-containing dehydratase protein [Xylariaceae sp. FL1272]|nr:heme-containing dehydratase protein [Xylariaceae sp. FL1272]